MATISELTRLKSRYIALSSAVSGIISTLGTCVSDLEPGASKIGDYYNVDESSYDKGALSEVKKDIDSIKGSLSSKVIPGIEAKINEINSTIAYLEEEERKAAEAAEAARKAAEEEAQKKAAEAASSTSSTTKTSSTSSTTKTSSSSKGSSSSSVKVNSNVRNNKNRAFALE